MRSFGAFDEPKIFDGSGQRLRRSLVKGTLNSFRKIYTE